MPTTSATAPPIANAFIAVMRDSEISLFENMPPPPLAGASSAACAPVRSMTASSFSSTETGLLTVLPSGNVPSRM